MLFQPELPKVERYDQEYLLSKGIWFKIIKIVNTEPFVPFRYKGKWWQRSLICEHLCNCIIKNKSEIEHFYITDPDHADKTVLVIDDATELRNN